MKTETTMQGPKFTGFVFRSYCLFSSKLVSWNVCYNHWAHRFFLKAMLTSFQAPEVMLKAAWSYPVDIWNVGVMIWDLFEGKHMFSGNDPDGKGYSTRAHLAEVIGILGPPPLDLIKRGARSSEFFDKEGRHFRELAT
jgi:serine/threonine protein kinase